ncbi:DegT/DnrJ/EryC1/StrS family aminotransferase [Thermodesulfobacteriota bacterium B35]
MTSNLLPLPSDQDHSGRTLAAEEVAAVARAIASGTLTSTKGTFVREIEQQFSRQIGVQHCHACTSGTAAIHLAVAAIDPEPGDEIITTAITDMGALTPILYQGAIPVFADVDPDTYNVTPESIEACIHERTRAIIVTHLFGNPCNMKGIMTVAEKYSIPVIEDCAQAYLAETNGRRVGSIGTIGCFSLQQGKHITTGEGGLVTTNDSDLARRIFLLINKAWGYGDASPDHYFAALNYRMNELTGAVALSQLQKLADIVDRRIMAADRLTGQLTSVDGAGTPVIRKGDRMTYWKYCLNIDKDLVPGGAVALAGKLKERGIMSAPRYIRKPAFQCAVFRDQRTFGTSRYPFTLARPETVDYSEEKFPGTFAALEQVLVLPWNERYSTEHVDYIAESIRESIDAMQKGTT